MLKKIRLGSMIALLAAVAVFVYSLEPVNPTLAGAGEQIASGSYFGAGVARAGF